MGQEVSTLSSYELRKFRKDLGMIFQNFNLMQRKNVFDNVALPLEVWGYSKEEIKTRVLELLKLIENAYLKELRRLRLEEEALLKK